MAMQQIEVSHKDEPLVAACLDPNLSVSEFARSAGIHADQLFQWRKELCQVSSPRTQQFIPVKVVTLPAPDPAETTLTTSTAGAW